MIIDVKIVHCSSCRVHTQTLTLSFYGKQIQKLLLVVTIYSWSVFEVEERKKKTKSGLFLSRHRCKVCRPLLMKITVTNFIQLTHKIEDT